MSFWRWNGGIPGAVEALKAVVQPPSPSSPDRIVAVGLLTQRDIDVLGTGFRRLFPVEHSSAFDDLLRKLDACDAVRNETPRPR